MPTLKNSPPEQTVPAPVLGARHRCSGLNSRFHGEGRTFADYTADCRDMIARAHAGRDDALLQKIIDCNAPFELEPAQDAPRRRGILLLHGMSDSPYVMRYLGEFFRKRGFHVMAMLLPGHGTQPGDLLEVRWRDWMDATRYGVARLAEKADDIHIGGFSTGAALGALHSLDDARIRGLLMFAPALGISPRAAYANIYKLYGWLLPRARWLNIRPDSDICKYESFPMNAVAQTYALLRELGRRLQGRTLDIPLFTAASLEDTTVDVNATLAFMARARHADNRMVLYSAHAPHALKGIPADRVEWVNSAMPERRILGSAHIAIMVPPEDAHYGAAGEYANCLHYYPNDIGQYTACLSSLAGEVNWGEVTAENLRQGLMRRLTYNPHYAELEASIARWLAR